MAADSRAEYWIFLLHGHDVWDRIDLLRDDEDVRKFVAQEELTYKNEPFTVVIVHFTKSMSRSQAMCLFPSGTIYRSESSSDWSTPFARCISLKLRSGRSERFSKTTHDPKLLGHGFQDFELKVYKPYPYQREVMKRILDKPSDSKKIIWVCDKFGNTGKSEFVDYLTRLPQKGMFSLFNRNPNAILYMLEKKDPVNAVLFDIPSHYESKVPYGVLEEIKNGRFTVDYRGFKDVQLERIPHIVVFANFKPNPNAIRDDRYVLIEACKPYEESDGEECKLDF